jgi:catechol 2,3-dioxygenase-like lactoylglutathione lyase family enzyme
VVNHIAIAVPDSAAAQKWYCEVFGFRALKPEPRLTDRAETPAGPIFKIYGDELMKVKTVFLTGGNGVGVELFEFIDPPISEPAGFNYTRGGYFHMGITDPDPVALLAKAVSLGAKQIGETVSMYEGEQALYLKDPWGNVIEVLSCSFEQLMGNRG